MRQGMQRAAVTVAVVFAAAACVGIWAGPASAQGTRREIPIKVLHGRGGQVLVAVVVTVHTRRYYFLVDTGASETLIDQRIARRLHLRVAGRPRRAAGVFGRGSVSPFRISGWGVGNVQFPAQLIYATRLGSGPVVGLLGSDVLSRFGAVTIDYARRVLSLG